MSSEANGNNALERSWSKRELLTAAENKIIAEIQFLVDKENLNTKEVQNLALLVIAWKLGVEEDEL